MKILKIIKKYKDLNKECKDLKVYMDCKDKEALIRQKNHEDIVKVQQDYIVSLELRVANLQRLYYSTNGLLVEFIPGGITLSRKEARGENIVQFPKQDIKMKWK